MNTVRFIDFIDFQYNHFSTDITEKQIILSTLEDITSQTCIQLENLSPGFNEPSYVYIRSGTGCLSAVGYTKGEIHMSLNKEVCKIMLSYTENK
jgi:hypothetical protein